MGGAFVVSYTGNSSIAGNVGIGTTGPLSKLDVNGGVAIGTYAGTATAPSNSLIVSNGLGVASSSLTTGATIDFHGATDSLLLPTGTTGQRPSATAGMVRYNSTTPAVEAYVSNTWASLLTSSATVTNDTLGSTATAVNPHRSGDLTTGLYSDTASTVEIATSGTQRLRITATGSVGIGTATPSQLLDVNGGVSAGISSGYYLGGNKAFGIVNGDITSLAGGINALSSQTSTSANNTAFGTNALQYTTTGVDNTAFGLVALQYTSTGHDNTAVGYGALFTNANGYGNTGVGSGVGTYIQGGNHDRPLQRHDEHGGGGDGGNAGADGLTVAFCDGTFWPYPQEQART